MSKKRRTTRTTHYKKKKQGRSEAPAAIKLCPTCNRRAYMYGSTTDVRKKSGTSVDVCATGIGVHEKGVFVDRYDAPGGNS